MKRIDALRGMQVLMLVLVLQTGYTVAGVAQEIQAEPVDSLAVEAEHQAATQQKKEPKEITIYISGAHKAVAMALLDAVDEGTLVTGIADFDSLSSIYGLIGIDRTGRMSSGFYGNRFRLTFSPDADVATVAEAYWSLSYIQSVELEAPPEARASKLIQPVKNIENRGLRLLAKVATGTASGIVFTAMSMFVLDTIVERKGAPDADAYRPIGFLLVGGAIGCSVGFPLGVSKVDPYDSLPITLLAGVIPGLSGYSLLRAHQQSERTAFLFMYVVPAVNSLIASELWRRPPRASRVSFALASTLNGGLSAVTTLRF